MPKETIMTATIAREALQAALASARPPILVEALPPRYFLEGHLPGAVHLPHDQVRALGPMLLPDKEADIVVYCASATCRNSHIAARALAALGYVHVSVYAGGKKDWVEAGLPLEAGGEIAQAA
jgi:rhodanese-related sulfurtransferase